MLEPAELSPARPPIASPSPMPVRLPVAWEEAMTPMLLGPGPPLPFWPTRPPAKLELKSVLPGKMLVVSLTSPLALERTTAPVFSPTSPPMMLLTPPETLPLADDPVIVPSAIDEEEAAAPPPKLALLLPTRPPAKFNPKQLVLVQNAPSPTLTVADELELAMPPPLKPTRPPALIPANDPPSTRLPFAAEVTDTLMICPKFCPASRPIAWVLPRATMLASCSTRSRTTP